MSERISNSKIRLFPKADNEEGVGTSESDVGTFISILLSAGRQDEEGNSALTVYHK